MERHTMPTSLKRRLIRLEETVKQRTSGEGYAVVVAQDCEEFDRKKEEYLATHPKPEKWIRIVYFSEADCLNKNLGLKAGRAR